MPNDAPVKVRLVFEFGDDNGGKSFTLCIASNPRLDGIAPVFHGEHVRIEIGDPLFSVLGDSQIAQCVFDVGSHYLPEKLRIIRSEIGGTVLLQHLGHAGLAELVKQRGRLA